MMILFVLQQQHHLSFPACWLATTGSPGELLLQSLIYHAQLIF